MTIYLPPFTITPKILALSEAIAKKLGIIEGTKMIIPTIQLRKSNQIKTIQSSLSIEGNTLSVDQVSDLLDGKRIIGPEKDIVEVKNAIKVYERLDTLNPLKIDDLFKAHSLLMNKLIKYTGQFRAKNVGIFQGEKVAHMAPKAARVPKLMEQLFEFLQKYDEISWLLKSCIFHYEFEFIHPFEDGNGRMGRLWQQLILIKHHPIFAFISIEEIIKENQNFYYKVLGASDQSGESTVFIEFSLDTIFLALSKYAKLTKPVKNEPNTRLEYARLLLQNRQFSRKDYHQIHPNISTSTASRDLAWGIDQKVLKTFGAKNQIHYQFQE